MPAAAAVSGGLGVTAQARDVWGREVENGLVSALFIAYVGLIWILAARSASPSAGGTTKGSHEGPSACTRFAAACGHFAQLIRIMYHASFFVRARGHSSHCACCALC